MGKLGVIELGVNNVGSISRALSFLKADFFICKNSDDLKSADKLILPGVGNFGHAMNELRKTGMDHSIKNAVLKEKKPILGICLGMQLFAESSEESPGVAGLGLIRSKVVLHRGKKAGEKIPHIGWNDVNNNGLSVLNDINNRCFYFVHSYELLMEDKDAIYATSEHGVSFTAALEKENIFGVQFHPERSQKSGLKLIEKFMQL